MQEKTCFPPVSSERMTFLSLRLDYIIFPCRFYWFSFESRKRSDEYCLFVTVTTFVRQCPIFIAVDLCCNYETVSVIFTDFIQEKRTRLSWFCRNWFFRPESMKSSTEYHLIFHKSFVKMSIRCPFRISSESWLIQYARLINQLLCVLPHVVRGDYDLSLQINDDNRDLYT